MIMRRYMPLFLFLAAACGKPPAEAPPPAVPQGTPMVAVVPVVSQTLAKSLRLSGELLAYRDVVLHARVQGFVEKIDVDRGSLVKQGQQLLQMTAPEVAAQRHEAEAKLASDLATYDRLKEASATPGVVSKNDVNVAAQTVEGDRARVRLWQDNESYLKVSAPFDGVITERSVHEGSLVTPAAALLRLQETAKLRLVVAVPETAAGSLPENGTLTFTAPAHPGVAFTGKVARNAHALDARTRSMPVELDVDNADGRLAPGMFPEVQWPMKRVGPSLFVPPTAIVSTTERTFVIRVKDGAAEWVDVKPGVSTGALQEVFGKLAEGDVVVLRATDELRSGAALTPKLPAPAK
jgi:membrane fusion protein (multidrug efflux system)